MPLTIARLDGLLDCNLKHPGYLTKEDSKAREEVKRKNKKKRKKKQKKQKQKKNKNKKSTFQAVFFKMQDWKNVLPCGESNPGRGGESAES